jgi:hypothetical protein
MTSFQKFDRSNNTTQIITTSVIAVTARRVVQLMPRLTHQSSAQLMMTGTMISSCNPASAFTAISRSDIYGRRIRYQPSAAPELEHDPEKWKPVFPRDKREALPGDHAQTKDKARGRFNAVESDSSGRT